MRNNGKLGEVTFLILLLFLTPHLLILSFTSTPKDLEEGVVAFPPHFFQILLITNIRRR
jgi:hypothetical protein